MEDNSMHQIMNSNDSQEDPDPLYLLQQLEVAKQYIKDLETRLEKREQELRVSKLQTERSLRRKNRRQGLVSPLNVSQNITQQKAGQPTTTDASSDFGDYMQLTICGFNDSVSVPFRIRFLNGNTYIVGPEGVTIGCGLGCGIRLPSDTNLSDHHSVITSKLMESAKRQFFLKQLAKFKLENENENKDCSLICLNSQSTFNTGIIQWCVSAVPPKKLIQSQLFQSIRSMDFKQYETAFSSYEEWNNLHRNTSLTAEIIDSDTIDLNGLEDKEFCIITDTDASSSQYPDFNRCYITNNADLNEKFSLLHVGVDYGCSNIVNSLLAHGVKVDMQCGSKLTTPLHIATKQNFEVIVSQLLSNGVDIDKTDSNGCSALSFAESYSVRSMLLSASMLCSSCFGGDIDEVRRLLTVKNTSSNVKAYKGHGPLHLASMNGHEDIVKLLLQNMAPVNGAGGKHNRTPLHLASMANQVAIANLLIQYGAVTSMVDSCGYMPLDLSSSKEMCQLLQQENNNSLCVAVQSNDVAEVKRLLDENILKKNVFVSPDLVHKKLSTGSHGRKTSRQMILKNLGLCALVDQKNDKNLAPIHLAAAAGNKELVHLLLSYGAKLDMQGGLEKWTALFFSALAGHANCTQFLLMVGSDDNYCDARGLLCIDQVENHIKSLKTKMEDTDNSSNGVQADDIEVLIPGQFLNKLDKRHCILGTTAESHHRVQCLHRVVNVLRSGQQKLLNALKDNDMDSLKTLLREEEVNVNSILCETLPITALNYAASIGLADAAEILLHYKADLYGEDSQSYTCVHTAADCGHIDVLEIFLNHAFDVNRQTRLQKYTPLHIASLKGRRKVVELLLTRGADATIEDRDGNNAFDLAKEASIKSMLARGAEKLYVAIMEKNILLISELLKTIDVSVRFKDELTPLHVAAEKGFLNVSELLIQNGGAVNLQGGRDLSTPLHCAARSNSPALIHLLVKHGGDLTSVDIDEKTPFEVSTNQDVRKALFKARKSSNITTSGNAGMDNTKFSVDNYITDRTSNEKCRICLTESIDTMVMPCGHKSFCSDCVLRLDECALDRRPILNIIPLS